jgi:hypothetical protein
MPSISASQRKRSQTFSFECAFADFSIYNETPILSKSPGTGNSTISVVRLDREAVACTLCFKTVHALRLALETGLSYPPCRPASYQYRVYT